MRDRIVDYLQLGRAHTAPVEMFGLPLAAYLGGFPPYQLPVFVLLGWLVHSAGFGMNSLVDYLYGFDRQDPSKQHHPLVSGRVSVLQASVFVFGLQLASTFYFFLLGPALVSSLAFIGYVVFGWAYNLLAKRNKVLAMAELALSMGLLFFAVATIHGVQTSTIAYASVYTAVVASFQIGVCGDLKDLDAGTSEVNILRQLGCSVSPNGVMSTSTGGHLLSDGLSVLKALAITAVAYTISPSWAVLAFVLAGATFAFYSRVAMEPGPYNHARRLKVIGVGEVWSYIVFVITLFPLFLSWWPWAAGFFLVLPPTYYFAMNRILWTGSGSGWAPGV